MSFRDETGPRNLPSSLNQQLHTYALAASAAGVAVLALTPAANAEIVYTATNVHFSLGTANIDFNHDGVNDARIIAYSYAYHNRFGTVSLGMPVGNGFVGHPVAVSALSSGAVIGPTAHFAGGDAGILARNRSFVYGYFRKGSEGNWRNVNNRYLGVKFQIGGQTHYGWVRMSINVISTYGAYDLNITGFAYETVANQSIVAGQTKGAHATGAQLAVPQPDVAVDSGRTLGMLAAGALAEPLWRKEPTVE